MCTQSAHNTSPGSLTLCAHNLHITQDGAKPDTQSVRELNVAELELAILQLVKRLLIELVSKLRHDLLYKEWTDKDILHTRAT